jgi:hypothetical protein
MDLLRKEALKKLAKELCWYWEDCETGAPAVDPKRPYGNSDVDCDILELFEMKPMGDDGYGPCWSKEQREWAMNLHKDMLQYLKDLTGAK